MIEDTALAPATEWEPPTGCWIFLRADGGPGYWLGAEQALEISPGSALLLPPSRSGVLRASRLAAFRGQWFRFCPDLMGGVLTMSELHLFKKQRPSVRLFPPEHPVAQAFQGLELP